MKRESKTHTQINRESACLGALITDDNKKLTAEFWRFIRR